MSGSPIGLEVLTPDICVIGAGSGGLSVAAGAAAFGVEVVLIEKGKMGGDCLNTGCVPSKALLASAKACINATGFSDGPRLEAFRRAKAHVDATIAAIAPHDSQERFEGLGVTVLRGEACFIDDQTVQVDSCQVKARRFVIASGSSPLVPDIPGLETVSYFTNETLFEALEPKDHLLIVGGGPVGLEMAQAHRRLGSRVSLFEAGHILAHDSPDHVDLLRRTLTGEGINLFEGARVTGVEADGEGLKLCYDQGGEAGEVSGSHLLLAVGRRANVDGLGLATAGVEIDRSGIVVDRSLRTRNRKIYAIGDVIGAPRFTHAAGTQAGLVLRAILFRLPVRFSPESIPWATYTSPEVAHVGFGLEEARRRYGNKLQVLTASFSENDRALAEGVTEGSLKLYVGGGGRLLGADIVGPQAGELAGFLSFAFARKARMKDLAGFVAPYPTLSELVRRAAISYYAKAPSNPWVRSVLRILRLLG